MNVDVLAIGAHADDIELGAGGTIHKITRHGLRVAILDLTRAEMSTRGTVEERRNEAAGAARVLGVEIRENAGLPDTGLANTQEQQRRIIPFLRALRPRAVLALMSGDHHPDHNAAHALIRDACFFSGLANIDTGQERHRPERLYYYRPTHDNTEMPQFVVDVSDDFDAKMEALRQYRSQFFNPEYPGAPTSISSQEFWEWIQTRAAYWGKRIGAKFGEPMFCDGPVGMDLLPGLKSG